MIKITIGTPRIDIYHNQEGYYFHEYDYNRIAKLGQLYAFNV